MVVGLHASTALRYIIMEDEGSSLGVLLEDDKQDIPDL